VPTFGAQLRQQREKQGVTLEEISLSTKIGTRMLRALEEEHFDQLPGGIFNKGFIRAYARCLGIDEDQAVADYLTATGAVPKKSEISEQAPILDPPPREDNVAGGVPWGAFAVVLLIIALGFAAWGFYSRESERTARDASVPALNSSNSTPTSAAEASRSQQMPVQPSDSSATAPQPYQQRVAARSVAESTSSPAAVSAPTSTPSGTQSQFIASTNPPLQLIVRAREDSWLSVFVDGEIVTRALLSPPAQKAIRAQNEIVVRAGNVGALDFEFNGKKLPTQGDYGEAKTLTFDVHGLQPSTPKLEGPNPEIPKTDSTKPEPPAQPPQ
jgi:cytoskeleton protein RodZ